MPQRRHKEHHAADRIGWLRAAVLGANDGIVSVASVMIGVAAANAATHAVLLAGLAALAGGAMSMAAGEYVSVSSQADSQAADLEREKQEIAQNPAGEQRELAGIYRARGLSHGTAGQVAEELMAGDALAAHARDELGVSDQNQARPLQAAMASAAAFLAGAAIPMVAGALIPRNLTAIAIAAASIVALAVLGALGARLGQAPMWRAVARVTLWGAAALAVTALLGHFVG